MKAMRRLFPHSVAMPDDCRVYGLGIAERMRPGIVHRAKGGRHFLLMYFHSAAEIGARGALMPPGTSIIWTPGHEQLYGSSSANWNHSWIAMNGVFVRQKLRELELPANAALPNSVDAALVENALSALFLELSDHARPDAIILRNSLENFLRALRRSMSRPAARAAVPQKFRALRRFIAEQFDRDVSLDELAKRVHVSRWHLCREFRKYFGVTPIEYALRLRMQHAAHLLREPELNISDIGRQCGYRDLFHFSKQFRKHHGLSPRRMRQQLWPRPPRSGEVSQEAIAAARGNR
jgi:AraC-like DNA-binding protein